jgi:hypothetical protein
LEPSANNIFVRSVDEDKFNIFLFRFEGEIPEGVIDAVTPFLQIEKRSKFHLGMPNVNIDLSAVLPIVLADKLNAKKLNSVCDVVELADISPKEVCVLISHLIKEKTAAYNLSRIELSDDAVDFLKKMTIDDIAQCLDRGIRAQSLKSGDIRLDEKMLMNCIDISQISHIGFGFGGTEK